ncbi:MAG: NAD(P)H-dependent oxidoreductase subunit E [Thermoleophilia bacterium]
MLGMLKAMRTTISHLPAKKITVQYPEEHEQLPERSRGLFRVVIDPAADEARCRACTLCETNCPVQVIRVNYKSKYELPVPNQARIAKKRVAAQEGTDLVQLKGVLDDYYDHGTGLVTMLQNTQEVYGYLPRVALQSISRETGISESQIYGVASFYNMFRFAPVGKHVLNVCIGTACHVAGAPLLVDALVQELGIGVGGTTADGLFTLQTVNCIGACALAPAARLGDDETFGRLTPDEARKIVRDLRHEEEA